MADALSVGDRGIVAPRLLNLDGTLQPTLRRAPTVRGALAEALVGGELAGRIGLGELIFDERSHERARSSAWATGAALLISWQVLVQVGPWNESFLLYSEETEFIFRAADYGWTMWYEPSAIVGTSACGRSTRALRASRTSPSGWAETNVPSVSFSRLSSSR